MFFYESVPYAAVKKEVVCPLCGQTLTKVKKEGKFGCSRCYDTFAPYLDLTPFVGTGYREKTEKERAQDLKKQLQEALKKEDYEEAARLRDQIREEGK